MRRIAFASGLRIVALAGVVSGLAGCEVSGIKAERANDAKVAVSDFPERVLWGDTHLHAANSGDAFGFGVRLGPEEALRFARGDEVTSTMGMKAKLSRPLDFLVIADHSDSLGATKALYEAPRLLDPRPDDAALARHDARRTRRLASRRAELIERVSRGRRPPGMLDREANAKRTRSIWPGHSGSRALQRAWQVHRVHGLRVHADAERRQPAPGGDLPRRHGQVRPGPSA